MSAPAFVVGFDLDLTLIDSRPGILAAFRALSAETGVPMDVDAIGDRLGPKLEEELANWFPLERVPAVAGRYRDHYRTLAPSGSFALPGAGSAIDAVRRAGGAVIVVTAKHESSARLCLDHLGLRADALVAHAYGPEKAAALRQYGVYAYVGDTEADMTAAREGGAVAIGVLTGNCSEASLRGAGADYVLGDLRAFDPLLDALTPAGSWSGTSLRILGDKQ
jgi:phosphoglycolate phosphatase